MLAPNCGAPDATYVRIAALAKPESFRGTVSLSGGSHHGR
jgi:hypothetical protein